MNFIGVCRMRAQGPRFAAMLLGVSAALAAAMAGAAESSSKGVAYRWVDEQGVVHYGDRVPPQYAQKEHSILNTQGVEVQKLDAQKSPQQIADEARTQQEVLRQKQHDSFLLTTYTSVKDIEALRDERLEQLNVQRAAAQQYVESLRSRLSSLQTQALHFRPYSPKPGARRMPDELAEYLVRTLYEMRTQSNAIVAKGTEASTLRSQFQADIERYRELHAVHDKR